MGPPACDAPNLVRVADSRWRIELAFELAKQEVGLDKHEVRQRPGLGPLILALWALALLRVVRAASLASPPPPKRLRDRAAWRRFDKPAAWPSRKSDGCGGICCGLWSRT